MVKPQISLIHPISNPFSRNAALALAESGLLKEIVTTIGYNPQSYWTRYLNLLPKNIAKRINQELSRRAWIPPDGVNICRYPMRETLRVLLVKLGFGGFWGLDKQQSLYPWVFLPLDAQFARQHLHNITAVYAYEDGAATTFAAAKVKGITCFYDLPIPYYLTSRSIQVQEAELFPELANTLDAVKEPAWKIERKEQELQLADHIFVASSMTKSSLLEAQVSASKISVIPYGAPINYFQPQLKANQGFRALFVGRVGARKGVHYLLQAWKKLRLSNAELLLVGYNEFPDGWLEKYASCCRYVPSVPHRELNSYYNSASVFVFPSLVEGFGLVLLEAMACGIPVIATPNTAAPDIITDGKEGFIIPIRNIEALQEKLDWCYRHPQELAIMGKAARAKAQELTWDLYRQQLAAVVSGKLGLDKN